jgi:hypothetical protein
MYLTPVMLRSFSWYKYSLVVGFLRKAGPSGVSRVRPRIPWICQRTDHRQAGAADRAAQQDLLFRLAQLLIRELRSGIRESAGKTRDKDALLRSLGLLLKPYTPLKDLPFRIAVNNFILMETANYCSIHLDEEELLMLWREVR